MTHDRPAAVQYRRAHATWRLVFTSVALAAVFIVGTASVGGSHTAQAASTITPIQINGAEPGSTLAGIGGMSVAGSSKLLFDYPRRQRSEILDYLFCSPMARSAPGYCTNGIYGAAMQRLKVEIGADSNAEIGAEPSIERQPGVVDCNVGWEFKLMAAARNRNPNVQIDALAWSFPGWIDPTGQSPTDRVLSQDTIDYLVNYVRCAAKNGTPISTLGLWNERGVLLNAVDATSSQGEQWVISLRDALNTAGFRYVKLLADDGYGWTPYEICAFPQTRLDVQFCNAISAFGNHYPGVFNSYPNVQTSGGPCSIQECVDDSDTSAISYTGAGWFHQQNTYSQPGYRGTWSIDATAGDSASFTFTGTSIKWIGMTGFNMGMADVYIDGQLAAQNVDLYSPYEDPSGSPPQGGHYQKVLFSQSDLSPGQHTIEIVNTGKRNPASSGTYINIDAFAVQGAPDNAGILPPDIAGKPVLASEDAPGLYDDDFGIGWYQDPLLRGDWDGARYLAQQLNTNYINGAIDGADIYTLLSSYYDQAQYAKGGLMTADTPWASGPGPTFDVQSRVWVVAHTTQFTQPGTWRYVGQPGSSSDTASCYLGTSSCSNSVGETGSYVTLRDTRGGNYAIVAETKDATSPQSEQFCLSGGLSTGTVHVWETNATIAFANVASLHPTDGCFSYTLGPDAVYTFTSENTGHAGSNTQGFTEQGMTLPYADDFQRYGPTRTQPHYFLDQQGGFETGHACPAGGRHWCLAQVITTEPIEWEGRSEPYTVIGNLDWTDYDVQARLTTPTGDSASVLGRLQRSQSDGDFSERARYQAQVTNDGTGNWTWTLYRVDPGGVYNVLSTGSYSNGSAWITVTLRMEGDQLTVLLDGTSVGGATDSTYAAGMAGLATATQGAAYDVADFDEFCLQSPNQGYCPSR